MKITIKNLQKKIPVNPRRIKKAISKALAKESAGRAGEITVLFVKDSKIKELNRKYHNRDSSTDVLAFDCSGIQKEIMADIIVSTDTAYRNAKLFKTSPEFETTLYVIHGLLHILGYGDHQNKERLIMRRKEKLYAYL